MANGTATASAPTATNVSDLLTQAANFEATGKELRSKLENRLKEIETEKTTILATLATLGVKVKVGAKRGRTPGVNKTQTVLDIVKAMAPNKTNGKTSAEILVEVNKQTDFNMEPKHLAPILFNLSDDSEGKTPKLGTELNNGSHRGQKYFALKASPKQGQSNGK